MPDMYSRLHYHNTDYEDNLIVSSNMQKSIRLKIKKVEIDSGPNAGEVVNMFVANGQPPIGGGLPAAQKYETFRAFNHLKTENFEQVVEIGTWKGGMALMLRKVFDCPIYTFDNTDWPPIEKRLLFNEYGIKYIIADVFASSKIINLLNNDKKTLLLCDGGHKQNEFTKFAPYLNAGDLIGCHDYFPKESDRNGTWSTCEITNDHIIHICKQHFLKEYKPEIFNKVVWSLRQKK